MTEPMKTERRVIRIRNKEQWDAVTKDFKLTWIETYHYASTETNQLCVRVTKYKPFVGKNGFGSKTFYEKQGFKVIPFTLRGELRRHKKLT